MSLRGRACLKGRPPRPHNLPTMVDMFEVGCEAALGVLGVWLLQRQASKSTKGYRLLAGAQTECNTVRATLKVYCKCIASVCIVPAILI